MKLTKKESDYEKDKGENMSKKILDDAIENFNLGVNTSNAIIDKDMDNLREENARLRTEIKEIKDLLTPEQEWVQRRQKEE